MKKAVMSNVLIILSLFLLSGCNDKSDTIIKMADKEFLMPYEDKFPWWSFSEDRKWLRMTMNMDTYSLGYKADTLDEKRKRNGIMVGPLSTMDRGYYWSEKDPLIKNKPKSCETKLYNSEEYLLCDYGKEGKNINDPHIYVIKSVSNKDDVSYLRCTVVLRLPNPMCNVRAKFLGNLQINYGYNISYFEKAIETDQRIRRHVLNFYIDDKKKSGDSL